MTVNKRKKFSRQRASHTHGWGSKKKHRGSGNRGGKGMAGTGKRADSIKPSIWKDTKFFGKHGFIPKGVEKRINPVNIEHIEENLEKLLEKKLISKEGGFYVVDLEKLGHNKLLGKGIVKNKIKVNAEYASSKVIEKIKEAGGEVIVGSAR